METRTSQTQEDIMFTCKKHKAYKGQNVPKADCVDCRKVYTSVHYASDGRQAVARKLNRSPRTIGGYAAQLGVSEDRKVNQKPVEEQVQDDRTLRKARDDKNITAKKYRILQKEFDRVERLNQAILDVKHHEGSLAKISLKRKNGKGEGIANVLLSDYHMEERVLEREVEGMNAYNLDISGSRLREFFRTTLRYVQIEQQTTDVHKLVLWMLGDNITGWLHEESIHTTLLAPTEALVEVRMRLFQGIQYLLDHSDLELLIPCVVGNHGRMTRKPNHATENGNSLEYILYHFLASDFADNDRVTFLVPESGFAFVEEFGYVIRGHHGHRIRYQGGVQGIGVPASKKIAQWNKLRSADLDVFGHHHTAQDGENFVTNGSIIGYNSYAYKGGFSYQPAEQKFFMVHSKWGRRNLSRSIYFTN